SSAIFSKYDFYVIIHFTVQFSNPAGIISIKHTFILIIIPSSKTGLFIYNKNIRSLVSAVQLMIGIETFKDLLYLFSGSIDQIPVLGIGKSMELFYKL